MRFTKGEEETFQLGMESYVTNMDNNLISLTITKTNDEEYPFHMELVCHDHKETQDFMYIDEALGYVESFTYEKPSEFIPTKGKWLDQTSK